MNAKTLSIRGLITTLLIALGIIIIGVSFFMTRFFQEAAYSSQREQTAQVVEVVSGQVYQELVMRAKVMGEKMQAEKGFRQAIKHLVKSPGDATAKATMVAALNEQFHRGDVTLGYIKPIQLRVLNTDIKVLAESSQDSVDPPPGPPAAMVATARSRKGAERLKILASMVVYRGIAYYNVLVPIGGLRLEGYLELLIDPVHNLQETFSKTFTYPFTIDSIDGRQLFKSENWQEDGVQQLAVEHWLHSQEGEPALRLTFLQDISQLNSKVRTTQAIIIATFAAIFLVALLLVLFILNRTLFKPIRQLLQSVESCAAGDLTVRFADAGLQELRLLGEKLQVLTANFRDNVTIISSSIHEVTSDAEQMTAVAKDHRLASEQLQLESEQLATSINELASSAKGVAQFAAKAEDATIQAEHETTEGRKVVEETLASIQALVDEIEQATQVVHALENGSNRIGSVSDVIKAVAEQTNLLALNASIEAARAGEYGRGFSVVADEVRGLAQKTHHSTNEISGIIEKLQRGAQDAVQVMKNSRDKAQEGLEQVRTAGRSFSSIAQAIDGMVTMNAEIAEAANEQSGISNQLNQSIANIVGLTHQGKESAQHTATASEHLSQLAENLTQQIQRFQT